jgi:hypothetical protein
VNTNPQWVVTERERERERESELVLLQRKNAERFVQLDNGLIKTRNVKLLIIFSVPNLSCV